MQYRENHARSYVCLKGREEKGYYGWASECLEYGMGQYMLCPRKNRDPRTADISMLLNSFYDFFFCMHQPLTSIPILFYGLRKAN